MEDGLCGGLKKDWYKMNRHGGSGVKAQWARSQVKREETCIIWLM